MAFKADAAKIKRWREERHWSQEHLAELAGIGLRTVQRIENGEQASRDSLTALAAAFQVDALALCVDPEEEAARTIRTKNARVTAGLRLSLWIHLAGYVLGMIIFTGINIGTGSSVMLWATIWWTVGAAAHIATTVIVEVVTRFQNQPAVS
ncbi:MAG: helix-turn-helix transcriptional regulator [Pseudomonadota bacterium]|nr:helix-turn-helix transcriptional regulator [Pseudomonadota bacterium]